MLSLLKNIDQYEIILASQSPRRYELLKMIGLKFKVRPSHAEEINKDNLPPIEYTLKNARIKGHEIANKAPESLIISADTIVVHKGEILEKPKDEAHAREILKKLSGKTHEVVTGFGFILLSDNKSVFRHEVSKVTFRTLSQFEISAYINTGEPFDKAGGYGAQGAGSLLIKRIEGCFFNVVGLPLANFFVTLDKFLLEI
jgi:septum formation protein